MPKRIRKYHPLRSRWQGMMTRCYNPNSPSYPLYGGRGIRVCEEWHKFANFAYDAGIAPPGCTIDRIDPDGDYSAWNCQWSTHRRQAQNKRNNVKWTHEGKTLCIIEWARLRGLSPSCVYRRQRQGWSVSQILDTPPKTWKRSGQYRKEVV